jgi:outer membrane protein assembly factor BamB/tetratricopeptide (TPR) repeat protein
MSVERFIEGLEQRGLVSEQTLAKLREKATESPLSAKALAKYLVEKKLLTQPQATEILGSLLRSGVDIDPTSAKDDTAERVNRFMPVAAEDSVEGEEAESTEDSFVFEPFLKKNHEASAATEESEIGLAPASDDAPLEITPPVFGAEPAALPQKERPISPTTSDRAADSKANVEMTRRNERDELPVAELVDLPTKFRTSSLEEEALRKTPARKRPAKHTNRWDSPLMLVGGGALVLLVIGGLALAWLMSWESGYDKLRLAQEALHTGAYTQAITHYEQFLERFPRHRERPTARVKLMLVRLRKAVEASNFSAALDIAQSELRALENEEKFGETAHRDLTALLPRIALGLAKEAEGATDGAEVQRLVDQATAALVLANNTKYVPSSLRDEAELDQVRLALARVQRRQQAQKDLQEAVTDMEKAIAAGDTRAAYDRQIALVKQHPELAGNASLTAMLQKTTAAEQAAIRFVKEEQAAETSERPSPWIASLTIAHRRVKPPENEPSLAGVGASTVCIRVGGAVYALDVPSGRLLWRRYVGHASTPSWPIPIERDVLVVDTVRHELLRLESATGRLVWRQSIGEPFAAPLVTDHRAFVAAESGRLFVIDLTSGARTGYLQFAQPLHVPPTVAQDQQRLYLPGDHSSLYTISLSDLACLGVYYLGHAEGSITVPLVQTLDKLVVLQNDGVETSRLRLMSLDEAGAVTGQVVERRLDGLATSPPFISGRRLIVVTNRGQIEVYDLATGSSENSLSLVAVRPATGKQPIIRHAALTDQQHIWIADTQLTKYSILPTSNRLPVEPLEDNFAGSTFDHPLMFHGDALVHVRRPAGRGGVVVAACETTNGHTLWETDLAVPLAAAPLIDSAAKSLLVATTHGQVFRLDEAAIRSRIQDEPLPVVLASQSGPNPTSDTPPITSTIDLGQGRAVFCAAGSDRLLLYNPAVADGNLQLIRLESPLACEVTPLRDGFLAPTRIGQVFLLSASDGTPRATPFQPMLQPNVTWDYQPAVVLDEQTGQFVISNGSQKIYLVQVVDQPRPHLKAIGEAIVGPLPITSRIVALRDVLFAAGSSHLVRFRLPSLEPSGENNLPAPLVWGPFRAGDAVLLATADGQLAAVSSQGDVLWSTPFSEHGDPAGDPLVIGDSVVVAYRRGIVERRSLADGRVVGASDSEQPLGTGPVQFVQRLVLGTSEGTLLVLDQP